MKKKMVKKLVFTKETLRDLNTPDLSRIQGGGAPPQSVTCTLDCQLQNTKKTETVAVYD